MSTSTPTLRASVIGASGYAGGELVRLLATHPQFEILHLAANTRAGEPLGAVFPSLAHAAATEDLAATLLQSPDLDRIGDESDVVFLALPHGLSLAAVPPLLDAGAKVVDLGGDFRLRDVSLFERWYQTEHTAQDLLGEAVYGLPELFRTDIGSARLVANPGCYPTAAALALLPLAANGWLAKTPVIVDAKSGVSGAGRKASFDFGYSEINENLKAYGVFTHRHQPEMEQTLCTAGGDSAPAVRFVPHLVPMTRGILATCYASLLEPTSQDALTEAFVAHYREEPFVHVLEHGLPATKHVAGSNHCEVAVRVEGNLAVAIAAIDNLGKGAAGAAVANSNLMAGLEETTGLEALPLFP